MNLPSKRLNQIYNKMLTTNSRHGEKVSLSEKQVKETLPSSLITSNQRLAFTLLPAITVSSGRQARLNLAIVSLMTRPGALRTTAQVSNKSASSALEYVLCNVLVTGPRERTRVVRAERVERRLIEARVNREEHVGEVEIAAVELRWRFRVLSQLRLRVHCRFVDEICRFVCTDAYCVHEWRCAFARFVA